MKAPASSSPRARVLAVCVLLGAGALSGCSPREAGAAAVVGDRVISDADVQTATSQVNTALPNLQSRLTNGTTVVSLIIAPFVLDAAASGGHAVSTNQARQAIPKLANPSSATLTFVQSQLAVNQLTPAQQTTVLNQLKAAKIRVSPRYGTFNPKTVQLASPLPNWVRLAPGEAATRSGTGGSTGQ